MSNISNTKIITLTRGDTFSFPFTINVGSELYPQRYILKKVFTADSETNKDGDIIITFTPEDTICLNQAKYYYEIKLQVIVDGIEEIHTVQQKQEFWVVD